MVQQLRPEEPLFSCVIPIDSITGRQYEEIMTFGVSADEAKNKAHQLLADSYGCDEDEILKLLQKARIELLSPWCSADQRDRASRGNRQGSAVILWFESKKEGNGFKTPIF